MGIGELDCGGAAFGYGAGSVSVMATTEPSLKIGSAVSSGHST
jgi:hypothetical protein